MRPNLKISQDTVFKRVEVLETAHGENALSRTRALVDFMAGLSAEPTYRRDVELLHTVDRQHCPGAAKNVPGMTAKIGQ